MSKPDFFIFGPGAGGIHRNDMSETEVFAMLDHNEATLLQAHPQIDDDQRTFERRLGLVGQSTQALSEHVAWMVLCKLRKLRHALQQPDPPAWEVALLAMECANWTSVYNQPEMTAAMGRAYAQNKQPRRAEDELTMHVMRYLRRDRGLSWKETARALDEAALHGHMVARVEVERSEKGWKFSRQRKDQPDQVETYATSTLRDKKFSKA